jgi:hypothetical protein
MRASIGLRHLERASENKTVIEGIQQIKVAMTKM